MPARPGHSPSSRSAPSTKALSCCQGVPPASVARMADIPTGSVNRLVEDRLHSFAHIRQSFGQALAHERNEGRP